MKILSDVNVSGTLISDNITGNNTGDQYIDGKVEKVEDHELISLASLIHRARMSIRQDNTNMKIILR
jgi:hypothetical protein